MSSRYSRHLREVSQIKVYFNYANSKPFHGILDGLSWLTRLDECEPGKDWNRKPKRERRLHRWADKNVDEGKMTFEVRY